MDWMGLYNKNADFKMYVDKYSKKHGVSVWEALKHKLVQSVGEEYAEKAETTYSPEDTYERFQQHISSRFEDVL